MDINNHGDVVGSCWWPIGLPVLGGTTSMHQLGGDVFLWRNGKRIKLSATTATEFVAFGAKINDAGQVIFQTEGFPTGPNRSWFWDDGVTTEMGPFELFVQHPPSDRMFNTHGQVVGTTKVSGYEHPILWQNGKTIELGGLSQFGEAAAINERGQVVGVSGTIAGPSHAFLWENGVMRDLGTLDGDDQSAAWTISDDGRVTGTSGPHGSARMFVWQNGTISDLTGIDYVGTMFNKRGDMVGWRQPWTSGHQSLLWRQGVIVPTGLRFALADFNDRDQILPQYVQQKDGTWERPYLWDNGRLLDFGAGASARAVALNDRGQIVGSAKGHAAVWARQATH
jgi:probable HAF family extracellular repeat protein